MPESELADILGVLLFLALAITATDKISFMMEDLRKVTGCMHLCFMAKILNA